MVVELEVVDASRAAEDLRFEYLQLRLQIPTRSGRELSATEAAGGGRVTRRIEPYKRGAGRCDHLVPMYLQLARRASGAEDQAGPRPSPPATTISS